MAIGWNGPDPVADIDATAYELGTEYLVNTDITVTGVRIWADASEINLPGRTATIWTTGGGVLATVSLPSDLPTGWTVFDLAVPLPRTAGSHLVVSYGTGGNEGAAAHALDTDVTSADGAVTALSAGNSTGGRNGRFHVGAGVFPTAGNNNRVLRRGHRLHRRDRREHRTGGDRRGPRRRRRDGHGHRARDRR
jgi:hypothetical protein